MNSEQIIFTDTEEEEEVQSRNVIFLTRAMSLIRNRRRKDRPTRNIITRDRYGAHAHLVAAFFRERPVYDKRKFRKTYRMSRRLFNRIVHEVTNHSYLFRENIDCMGKEGISPLMKCTSAIRQLAYDVVPDFLNEYLQISPRTSRLSLDQFCSSVMKIFGEEYLRKPTMTDVIKLYRHHEAKHGFSGMLGSLDCTDWEWFACSYGYKAQYVRRDHGPNPFILLEVVASQDLWIWHAFFSVSGANNDINVLHQSPLFNDLKTVRAPEIPFVANGVTYPWGYYLVDSIYPELLPFAKTIPEPSDDDHKRILYSKSRKRQGKMWNERLMF